jgi:hypothetical protein
MRIDSLNASFDICLERAIELKDGAEIPHGVYPVGERREILRERPVVLQVVESLAGWYYLCSSAFFFSRKRL